MFDLHYTSIHILNSALQPDSPGLLLSNPTKRYVRGREDEQLILFFTYSGQNEPIASSIQNLLSKAVETYYQTPGSATAALRQSIQQINLSLVNRNQRSSTAAAKLFGQITAISIRGFRLVGAQAGQTHALIMASHTCEHFSPIDQEDTRLGLTDAPALNFFQTEVGEESRIFFADRDLPKWEEITKSNAFSVSAEITQGKILSLIPSMFEGAMIRTTLGSGKIARISYPELDPNSSYKMIPKPIDGPPFAQMEQVKNNGEIPVTPLTPDDRAGEEVGGVQSIFSTDVAHPESKMHKNILQNLSAKFKELTASWFLGFQAIKKRMHIQKPHIKINVDEIKTGAKLSNSTMILIAIGVPILISTIALLVYINKGQTQQSLYYTALAQASANDALTQSDPQVQYLAWTNTIAYLDQAEKYKITDLTQNLRKQAENAVDGVDKTVRLEYRAAITNSLPPSVRIGKIIATATELYMLDSRKGQVYRATLTGHGYEIDNGFSCGPSPFVGPLIDIAALSINNIYKASLLGIDENGTLLFCSPEKKPDAIHLTPPSKGIGQITAFTYDSGNLYLLDNSNNSLWIYFSQDGIFKNSPSSLTATAPVNIYDVTDLAVNGPDLYLLHEDGHMSVCTISYVDTAPTQCTDPAAFSDSRPGREPSPYYFTGTSFNQIEFVPPPDPSIFLFDQSTNAVYHLSLKLNLHRVISPLLTGPNRLPKGSATAYTVSPNRTIFIAFNNQVYVAIAP